MKIKKAYGIMSPRMVEIKNKKVEKEYWVNGLYNTFKNMNVKQKIIGGLLGLVFLGSMCNKGLECSGLECECSSNKRGPVLTIHDYNNYLSGKKDYKPTAPFVPDTTRVDSTKTYKDILE